MTSDAGAMLARSTLWTALPIMITVSLLAGLPMKFSIVTALTAMFLACAVALCLADADIHLLMRGKHPKDAFTGRTCVIVGASRGFGAALAKYLAKSGATLVLCARGTAQLQVVKQTCEDLSPAKQTMHIVPVDVTASEEGLQRFVETVMSITPSVHHCFLAAGSSQSAAAQDTRQTTAHEIMALNASGLMDVGRAFLPHLIAQGSGRITVIASMAARVPSPGQAEYCASKHALFGYFTSVAAEIADRGVGITVACPGPIAGADTRTVFGPYGKFIKEEDESGQSKKVPMDRCCELVSRAAAFGVQEAWIARHPVLLVGYLCLFFPIAAEWLIKKVGPKRMRALQQGKSGYNYDLTTTEKKAT
eukprot:jgi/Ulvmu1/2766/UM014_0224.1